MSPDAPPDFTIARRGYDRDEVDRHLATSSTAIAQLRSRTEWLEERLAAAEEAVAAVEDRNSRAPDPDAPASERFAALGEETARILVVAEESAREMVERARADAEATTTTAERVARERIDSATEHATSLVADAEARRDQLISEAEARRDRVVAEAEARREQIVAETEQRRTQIVREAESRRDAAIAEMEARLDAVTEELRQRVAVHETEIDRLASIRAALVDALRTAVDSTDAAVDDLVAATDEVDGTTAGVLRAASTAVSAPLATDVTTPIPFDSRAADADPLRSPIRGSVDVPVAQEVDVPVAQEVDEHVAVAVAESDDLVDDDPDDIGPGVVPGDDADEVDDHVPDPADVRETVEVDDVEEALAEGDLAAAHVGTDDEPTMLVVDKDDAEPWEAVADTADQARADVAEAAEVADAAAPGTRSGERHGAQQSALRSALADAAVAVESGALADVDGDVGPALRRERALVSVRPGTLRRLRRGLQDVQNGVLQAVRERGEGVDASSLLPGPAVADTLAELARPYLDAAYRAGVGDAAVLAGDAAPDAPASDDLTVQLEGERLGSVLLEQLTTTLQPSLQAGIDADEAEASLSERVGEVFRDLKGPVVETVADRHLTRAYGRATLDEWQSRGVTAIEWVLGEESRCPEGRCRTNAGEGPVAPGQDFPSGEATPPVHDGCTCALAPAGDD